MEREREREGEEGSSREIYCRLVTLKLLYYGHPRPDPIPKSEKYTCVRTI